MNNEAVLKLSNLGCSIAKNEPLSKHTSFKIGGAADYFIEIPSKNALLEFLNLNITFYILGAGTNVLFSDGGFRGTVIKLTGEFLDCSAAGNKVSCGSGFSLQMLVNKTAELGLSGLECCAGIPGTVGGAVFGNAGSKDMFISDSIESVETIMWKVESGKWNERLLKKNEINFKYRSSGLKNCIITKINFALKNSDKNDILKTISDSLEKRKILQPLNLPNAGCIFKNPKGQSAGKLIDLAGLKGKIIGSAKISEIHANFIVNTGNAKASDVLELIALAKKTVKEKFGVELEEEIRIIK